MMQTLEFIQKAPGLIVAKDRNSVYQSTSTEIASLFGWRNLEEPIGKTDYDIPCKLVELANVFRKHDKLVMETRKKILLLEILPFTTGWQTLLVEKTAMINREGSVEGTIFQAIDVSDCAIFKKCLLLNNSDRKIINTVNKPASYVLNSEHSPLPLTCLVP